MKSKKIVWIGLVLVLIILLVLAYVFRPMTMNDIYDKPNFSGTVIEVYEGEIIVSVNEGEDELKSSDKMSVSLNVKLKDSMTHFDVGAKVKVFYDGTIAESYPAQIHTVYAILLANE